MNPTAIIEAVAGILKTVVDLGPTVITAVEDAKPFAAEIANLFQKGAAQITPADLDALEAKIDAIVAAIEDPLPADDGTTTT